MTPLPEHLMPVAVGKERLSKEALGEHQRDRILDAATAIFAKRGYQGTTIDHIVASSKIGVGTFYDLFASKEDCFLRAYERIVSSSREAIAAEVPEDAAWGEQARAALGALIDLIEADPMKARVALVEVQTAGARALARYEEFLDGVVPLLARGRKESPMAAELPDKLEVAIVGGLAWFLQQRIVRGEARTRAFGLGDLLEIAVEPYLGQETTAALLAGAEER